LPGSCSTEIISFDFIVVRLSGRDDSDAIFFPLRRNHIEHPILIQTQCDDSFFAVIEASIYPGFPLRVFKGGDAIGKREAVLALVEEIFRRIPNIAHGRIVRLSRSLVN
jgi:hypothetical protein